MCVLLQNLCCQTKKTQWLPMNLNKSLPSEQTLFSTSSNPEVSRPCRYCCHIPLHACCCQEFCPRCYRTLLSGSVIDCVSMAVTPSQLSEFRSLEQLDIKEGRMLELIYQVKHSIMEDTIQKRSSQAETLKYSPFCNLPLFLPSMFDRYF